MAEPYVIRDLSNKAADDATEAVSRACQLADTPGEMSQIAISAASKVIGMAVGFMMHESKIDGAAAAMLVSLMVGRLTVHGPAAGARDLAVKDYQALEAAGRGVSGPVFDPDDGKAP